MKIVLLDRDTLGEVKLDCFEEFGEFASYGVSPKENVTKRIKDADIVLTNKVVIDKEVMDSSPSLKLICVLATGMNNIDLEYAKEKGIEVKNVKGYSTASVAQTTIGMLLSLLQNFCYYDEYVKSFQYSKSPIFTNLSREFLEIKGKTWGIIGLGTIGKEVAKIATAFGAEVVYYSSSNQDRDKNYKRLGLEKLLSVSDIVSIHTPLNKYTNNLITKKELLFLKKRAIILNLGRGGIINEVDLAEILDTKEIYAGLDVLTKEPIKESNPLLHVKHKERLLITPHIAWASKEAREELIRLTYENIKDFLGDKNGKRA